MHQTKKTVIPAHRQLTLINYREKQLKKQNRYSSVRIAKIETSLISIF